MHLLENKGRSLPQQLAKAIERNQNCMWIGTLSFEDRCIASLSLLHEAGSKLDGAIAIEYPTTAQPEREDYERRKRNRGALLELGNDVFRTAPVFQTLNPYALQDLFKVLFQPHIDSKNTFVIFDITCMTKVHTLALASYLARHNPTYDWVCSYTIPENYTSLDDNSRSPGWKDVIIAPLAETAHLLNESHSRGVLVTGHEADRLLVAISELEPSGGLIIVGDTPSRPDLSRLSEQRNRAILRQLMRLRSSEWKKMSANVLNFDKIQKSISSEIALAKRSNAPVILFPFGPKPLLFEIGYLLAFEYPESSWFVYPVPNVYDVNYTEGIGTTYWFSAEKSFRNI